MMVPAPFAGILGMGPANRLVDAKADFGGLARSSAVSFQLGRKDI